MIPYYIPDQNVVIVLYVGILFCGTGAGPLEAGKTVGGTEAGPRRDRRRLVKTVGGTEAGPQEAC